MVDAHGTLMGNTSASDLRLFIQDPQHSLPILQMPIMDFLSALRRSSAHELREFPTISVRGG